MKSTAKDLEQVLTRLGIHLEITSKKKKINSK